MSDYHDQFDRNSSKYKQFKIRNTRRTSTPQLTRPKNIRSNIQSDLPMTMRSPPRPPKSPQFEIDMTYVSYVQWRHYLIVPNSTRKFKVRCTDPTIQLNTVDTAISGYINMLPYPLTPSLKAKKLFALTTSTPKSNKPSKLKVDNILNSRVIEEERLHLRVELGKRNQRIVDAVVPMIKKSLKRFIMGDVEKKDEFKSKTAKILRDFHSRIRRDVSEDEEYLLAFYENEE